MRSAAPSAADGRGRSAHGPPRRGAPARSARIGREMLTRVRTTVFALALVLPLVLAPVAAAAENDGRGFYGATNDKVVTNAGFIVIVFFPLFVFFMSMGQKLFDKRKEARKAARK